MTSNPLAPPHNIDAEQSVLGAILLADTTLYRLAIHDGLRPEHFYRHQHQIVYQAMLDLYEQSREIDVLSVTERLRQTRRLEAAGGPATIDLLAGAAPAAGNVREYSRIVISNALERELLLTSQQIQADVLAGGDRTASEKVEEAERAIFDLRSRQRKHRESHIAPLLSSTLDGVHDRQQRGGGIFGVRSGFVSLDQVLGGFQPGRLYVIAGRPGMGKTAILTDIAGSAIAASRSTQIHSLEMTGEELTTRLLARTVGMDADQLARGMFHEDKWSAVVEGSSRLSDRPLWIEDDPDQTVFDIRALARHRAMRSGLDLVLIDYLQLIAPGGKRNQNRNEEVGEMSRGLKALAKELEVPVIALSQLSRNLESRTDKRPTLADLRESGQIEQDADVVIFIYRDDYYDPDSKRPGVTELMIRKNRQTGRNCTILLNFRRGASGYVDAGVEGGAAG